MKPSVLPVAALGVAVSAFFLPPILALSGAAPAPARPKAMLLVQAETVPAPAFAIGRPPAGTLKAEPVRSRIAPDSPSSPIPQFTRMASNANALD